MTNHKEKQKTKKTWLTCTSLSSLCSWPLVITLAMTLVITLVMTFCYTWIHQDIDMF